MIVMHCCGTKILVGTPFSHVFGRISAQLRRGRIQGISYQPAGLSLNSKTKFSGFLRKPYDSAHRIPINYNMKIYENLLFEP